MIGELSALFTAIMWSGTSIAFSEASVRIGALQLNINRLYLFITILAFQIEIRLNVSQLLFLLFSGVVGFIFGDSFLFRSFKEIGPRLGMLIMSMVPAIAGVLAFFFLGEVLSWLDVTGMIITTGGIMLVVLERNPKAENKVALKKIGILYGFLGALGQAVGMILAKSAFDLGHINAFVATFVRVVAALTVFFPVSLILRMYKDPVQIFSEDTKSLKLVFIGSFVGPFLGVTGSLVAIANTEIGIASTIMAMPPILMLPMVRIMYKETLSAKAVIGAFIAVAGVALLFIS